MLFKIYMRILLSIVAEQKQFSQLKLERLWGKMHISMLPQLTDFFAEQMSKPGVINFSSSQESQHLSPCTLRSV